MTQLSDRLEDLRRGVDEIDARVLALLRERASLVQSIAAAKGAADVAAYQPAREAQLMRRLLACPVDPFGASAVFGIWREIVAASLRLQGDFCVAVLRSADGSSVGSALQHFGFNHRLLFLTSPTQILDAVASAKATVGVLPHWHDDIANAWWRHLVRGDQSAPRIVGRLPFMVPPAGAAIADDAFVVAAGDTEPSGDDRSLIVLDDVGSASRAGVAAACKTAGLTVGEQHVSGAAGTERLHFLDLAGHIGADDARVTSLLGALEGGTAYRIGGYAAPLGNTGPDADGGADAADGTPRDRAAAGSAT